MSAFVTLTEAREAAATVYEGVVLVRSGWEIDPTFGDGEEREGPAGGYVYALKPAGTDDGRRMLVFRGTRFDDAIMKEIPSLRQMGITTLKVFTAYTGRLRIEDGSIFRTMQIARDNGMLVMAHCENGDVIDTLVEQALAEGHTTPEWHALTRPGGARSNQL